LNTALEKYEAKRDKLASEMAQNDAALAKLSADLTTATELRAEESAENAATVTEAQEGKAAIESAIQVLDRFYKTQKNAQKASLVQQNPGTDLKAKASDIPDAGFDNSGYFAQQGGATGIIGMMEVIQGDFDRTVSETEKAETDAKAQFLAFERETKASIAEKEMIKSNLDTEHTSTVATIAEENTDLTNAQDLLDKAVQELMELHTACEAGGDTYEERVQKREEEAAALREALCILDKAGPVQTENC
jgi:hypothetical protein